MQQTTLFRQLVNGREGTEASAEPSPAEDKELEEIWQTPIKPAAGSAEIIGKLLKINGDEARWQFLQEQISSVQDEEIRDVCRKAIGMTNAQLIELFVKLEK